MARPFNAGVEIAGLNELRRDLRRVDVALPQELKALNREVGERIVLPAVRANAQKSFPNVAGGMTRPGSALAGTIRVLAQQTSAQVAMGGARFPYTAGMEWGTTGQNPRALQFPRRGGNRDGFILYPVIRAKQDEIRAAYSRGLDELLAQAGFS